MLLFHLLLEVFLNISNTDVVNLHGVPQWYTICQPDPNLPALPSPFIEQKQGVDTLLNKMKSSTQNLYLFTLKRTKKAGLGATKVSSMIDLPSINTPKENPHLSDLPKILEMLKDQKPKEAIALPSPAQKTNMCDLLTCVGELVDKDSHCKKSDSSIQDDSCHNDSTSSHQSKPFSDDNTENFDTLSLSSTLRVLDRTEVRKFSDGITQTNTAFRNHIAGLSTLLEQIRDQEKSPKEEKIREFLYSLREIAIDDGVCDDEQNACQLGAQDCSSRQLTLLSFLTSLEQPKSHDDIEPSVSSTTLGSTSSSVFIEEDGTCITVCLESPAEVDTPASSSELSVAGYSSASWAGGPRHTITRPCLKRYSFMGRMEQMDIDRPVLPRSQENTLSSSWESPLYDRLLPLNSRTVRQSLPPLPLASSSPVHKFMTPQILYRRNLSRSLNNMRGDEPDIAIGICSGDSDTDSSLSTSGHYTSLCDEMLTTDQEDGESSLDFAGCQRCLTSSCVPISQSLPQTVSITVDKPVRISSSLGSESLSRWKSADSLQGTPKRNK